MPPIASAPSCVPLQNRGELPLLYMLVFLFFVGHGAGPASLDARSRRP